MDEQWRNRARRASLSAADLSKRAKQRIDETAPELSRKVRQQIEQTRPIVAHRVRTVGEALTAPTPSTYAADPGLLDVTEDAQRPRHPRRVDGLPQDVQKADSLPQITFPNRPVVVIIAYAALLIAAVGSAIVAGTGVYGLIYIRGSVDKIVHLDPTGTAAFYANPYIDNAETMLMSSAIGLGIVFALAYVLVAHAVRVGHRWPRVIGTVLAVLSLPLIFLGPAAVVVVAAGVIAVLALWTQTARRYALDAKAAKRFARR